MNAFTKSKKLEFGDRSVVVREFTATQILTDLREAKNEVELLELATDLNKDEIESLSIEAWELIWSEFRELNGKLFEDNKGDGEGKR